MALFLLLIALVSSIQASSEIGIDDNWYAKQIDNTTGEILFDYNADCNTLSNCMNCTVSRC